MRSTVRVVHEGACVRWAIRQLHLRSPPHQGPRLTKPRPHPVCPMRFQRSGGAHTRAGIVVQFAHNLPQPSHPPPKGLWTDGSPTLLWHAAPLRGGRAAPSTPSSNIERFQQPGPHTGECVSVDAARRHPPPSLLTRGFFRMCAGSSHGRGSQTHANRARRSTHS